MIKKLLIGLLGLTSFTWGQTVHSAGREVANVFTNTNQFTLGITAGPITFANIGTISTSTTLIYISDATFGSSPCTGGGTGALAIRRNGIWDCSGGGNTNAVTGTGANTQVAFWTGSSVITGDTAFGVTHTSPGTGADFFFLSLGSTASSPNGSTGAISFSILGNVFPAVTIAPAGTTCPVSNCVGIPEVNGTFAVSASSPLVLNPATGNLTCPTCVTGATGANQALSNLASVAVNTSLLPGSDATIDLDSLTFRYNNAWWGGVTGWTNNAGVADTGFSRGAAGTVNCGNGAQSDTSCTLQSGKLVVVGAVASVLGMGQGTAPNITNFPSTVGWTVPTGVTAYFMMVPGAAGNGVLSFSNSVNQSGCTASSTTLCGSFVNIIIASGTANLPSIGSLSSGSCATTVTVSAPGTLSTDSIKWSYNAAPGSVLGNLVISSYVTIGNVNFLQCAPVSPGTTIPASTINWEVLR